MEEKKIIKEMLPDLGQIINAVPGEAFASKDAETLLIMQRRLEESDLKSNLTIYNLIFAKRENVTIEDITASAIAFVKMKVLIQEDLISFDAKSLRDLIKECRLYVDKMTNIIRLSKTHVMTADAYQKEKIERTICKNEALIEALEKTILDVENQIERIPKPLLTEEEPDTDIDSDTEQEKKIAMPVEKNKLRLSEKVSNFLGERRNKQEIENRLKDAEKESSDTRCLEIPFYDKALVATEVLFSVLQPIAEVGEALQNFIGFFTGEDGGLRNTAFSADEIDEIVANSGATDERETVIRYALSKVGYPYSQAQRTSGSAYDCSSLAYYSWNDAGVDISYGTGYPPTAAEGAKQLEIHGKKLSTFDLKPGDLVYYGGNANGRYMGIYHVAIYVGNGMAVEALNEDYGVVYQKLRTNKACMVCRPNM